MFERIKSWFHKPEKKMKMTVEINGEAIKDLSVEETNQLMAQLAERLKQTREDVENWEEKSRLPKD